MQYATAEDLRVWQDASEVSPRAPVVLRSASWLVRRSTATDRYAVTAEGLPSDPRVAEAFRDATCAQAAFWLAAGIDPQAGASGLPRPVASKSQLGTSISYSADTQAFAAARSLQNLVPEALAILRSEGLMTARVGRAGRPPVHYVESPVFP